MKIARVFSHPAERVIHTIKWRKVNVIIQDGETNEVKFAQANVEIPEHWSDNAARILANKYFRKAGVPKFTGIKEEASVPTWLCPSVALEGETGGETSATQVFHRLAGCWTYWGWKEGVFSSEDDAKAFYDECYMMLALQVGAPNSPQWFNTGLHWAYGIEGPVSGQWAVNYENAVHPLDSEHVDVCDDDTGNYFFPTDNSYERPQPHACFIQPVQDDLVNQGGIMDLWTKEVRLFKHGSGTGTNFSNIRGKNEKLSGGGVSSGLMSFLRIGDQAAGSIASGGVTRRAAKMVILDLDHPEVEDFINWKVEEEYKAACMSTGSKLIKEAWEKGTNSWYLIPYALWDRVENGFTPEILDDSWEGPAISSVSGQNSNNSLRVPNSFMEALDSGEQVSWNLKERTTGKTVKSIDVKELWEKINRAAWACADPGLQFDTTINEWHTCPAGGRINASNPCSEYMFLDDTACNLASLNLVYFLKDNGKFDYTTYEHAIGLFTVVLEISVYMASFPSREIAEGSYNYRTLGLGYANLGGLLMRLGVAYDSDYGRSIAAGLTSLMTGVAYCASAEMAKELGPFPKWSENADAMRRVLYNHTQASEKKPNYNGLSITPPPLNRYILDPELVERIDSIWEQVLKAESFRNAQVTLIAPTGTISFVMDCDTTGVEPDFALVKHKNLAGGGTMEIVNQSIEPALRRLGMSQAFIITMMAHIKMHKSLQGWPWKDEPGEDEYHVAQVLATANEIDPMAHVKMVAAVQPFLSGAVSKTINMPNNSTVEDVELVYKEAHRLGLKAVALYRDGSKLTQPLASVTSKERELPHKPKNGNGTPERELLPWRRTHGFTQKVKIDGQSVYLRTGEYSDGRLGEIFVDLAHEGSTLRASFNMLAIAISIGLQHRVPVEQYVKNFLHAKFEPAGIVEGHPSIKFASSIVDYIAKELAITYCGRHDLANVQPVGLGEGNRGSERVIVHEGNNKSERILGDVCPECHNASLEVTGTCVQCRVCSYNTGCS